MDSKPGRPGKIVYFDIESSMAGVCNLKRFPSRILAVNILIIFTYFGHRQNCKFRKSWSTSHSLFPPHRDPGSATLHTYPSSPDQNIWKLKMFLSFAIDTLFTSLFKDLRNARTRQTQSCSPIVISPAQKLQVLLHFSLSAGLCFSMSQKPFFSHFLQLLGQRSVQDSSDTTNTTRHANLTRRDLAGQYRELGVSRYIIRNCEVELYQVELYQVELQGQESEFPGKTGFVYSTEKDLCLLKSEA